MPHKQKKQYIDYVSHSDNEEYVNNENVAATWWLIPLHNFFYKHRYYMCNLATKHCVAVPKVREDVLGIYTKYSIKYIKGTNQTL